MTDYYNVETRTRKLDRFRRAQALAAERLRIEEEERKLREEEELEISLPRSTAPRLTSAVPSAAPSAPAGPGSNSLPTPTAPMPPSMDENKATADVKPAKRAHDEEVIETRQEKVPRLEAPARPKDDKEHDQRDVRDSRRGSSPYRRPSSPHHSFRRSPPLRLRMQADYDDRDSRPFRKYDSYKGHDDYYASSERRVPYPVQIDLGRKGGQSSSRSGPSWQ
ncbi:hypothetical protein N658DRAFT_494581 [Parathielavia hyrcaniae]|uniref:Uncharacterized protein n=1 Tax=Parathielavia hyrcaniae TaxID=113614 RepID=A0AAN6Q986_9PEZI|nr:hypothetical protein N658DRAFT_494581 [Parathielavia hyrcaniae]